MKKKLSTILRVVISLGILAYLFNNICLDVAEEIAAELLKAPSAGVSQVADRHGVTMDLAQRVREVCVLGVEDSVNLKALPWAERVRFAWSVGPGEVAAVFRRMDLRWFGAALLCFGGVCLLGAYRWLLILRAEGLQMAFGRALSIFFIGHFFNSFMLGATGGDVIKAWYVARETHHKKAEAVATVIVDRIIGLLALFVIALVMMAVFYHRVFDDPKMMSFAVATLAVVLGTVAITVIGFWRGFADKLPGLRQWLRRLPKYDLLYRMVESYRAYATQPKLILTTMVMSMALHLLVMSSIVCVAYGLAIRPTHGLADFFLYLPIINTVSAVPISISGFGVREGMYVAMLKTVGVAKPAALALSLLGYLVQLTWSIVGGGFFLTHRKELPTMKSMEADNAAS
jgi:uncharacterized protein (TIRG00374 family)